MKEHCDHLFREERDILNPKFDSSIDGYFESRLLNGSRTCFYRNESRSSEEKLFFTVSDTEWTIVTS